MKRKKRFCRRTLTAALILAMAFANVSAVTASETVTQMQSASETEETVAVTETVIESEQETVPESETETELLKETETETQMMSETETLQEEESESSIDNKAETAVQTEVETEAETETETVIETEDILLGADTVGKPSNIKNLEAVSGDKKILLKWDASVDATGYSVFFYDPSTKKSTFIGSTNKTNYTVSNLQNGQTYIFRIYAYNTKIKPTVYSNWSDVIKTVPGRPSAIESLKALSGNNCITLEWAASENATGYSVFFYDTNTKKSTFIGSTNKTRYVVNNLKNGMSYAFRIYAYNTRVKPTLYSEWSSVLNAIPGKPGVIDGLKAASENGAVVLNWKASKNATGYSIFIFDEKTRKNTFIGSTSKLTYTVSKLENGKKYAFRIYAYNTKVKPTLYSDWSKVAYAVPGRPAAITDLKAVAGSKEIYLSWGKIALAKHYSVYQYDASSKKWIWKKNVVNTNCLISGLENGTTYQFYVKSWNKIDGTLYDSEKSNVIRVTPKQIQNGWLVMGSSKYYYRNGSRLKGMQKVDGKYYFFNTANGAMKTGWIYFGGYKFYFNPKTGVRSSDVSGVIGRQSSYVIKINKARNTVTVYAKDGNNGYIIPVKAMICSVGSTQHETPTGTFYTKSKWRWQILMGPTWGQWVTQIYGGIYFHSVFYQRANDNNSLSTSEYNKLGRKASHGCVRLTAADAKWLYDNCASGTKVVIYNDSSVSGALGKPSAYTLPSWHTWDPTDPNMKYKCKQRGCH